MDRISSLVDFSKNNFSGFRIIFVKNKIFNRSELFFIMVWKMKRYIFYQINKVFLVLKLWVRITGNISFKIFYNLYNNYSLRREYQNEEFQSINNNLWYKYKKLYLQKPRKGSLECQTILQLILWSLSRIVKKIRRFDRIIKVCFQIFCRCIAKWVEKLIKLPFT